MSDEVVYRSHVRVERVLGFHADFCPVARTIRDCVEITTTVEFEDIEA